MQEALVPFLEEFFYMNVPGEHRRFFRGMEENGIKKVRLLMEFQKIMYGLAAAQSIIVTFCTLFRG